MISWNWSRVAGACTAGDVEGLCVMPREPQGTCSEPCTPRAGTVHLSLSCAEAEQPHGPWCGMC